MEKENNDYYEPTIKTSRVDEITKEQALKLLDTITKDRNNLKNEQQQLISFLKNNIKECENNKDDFPNEFSFWIGKLEAFQEVLDFVNKGGKE